MRNKGFTLIELLAVIVILAIIALIATPIVLGIINDSRKSADQETAKLIVSHFETAYSVAYMQTGGVEPTLEKIKSSFNMDGVKEVVIATENVAGDDTHDARTKGEMYVVSESGNVKCHTTTTGEGEKKQVEFSCEVTEGETVSMQKPVTVAGASE